MSQVQKGLKSLDSAMAHSAGDLEDRIKMEEVMEGHYIVYGFGNVGVIFTSEGIVVIDTSTSKRHAQNIYKKIREISDAPIKYIVYTHGHGDHVNNADVFKEEGTKIIAHENVIDRFRKYEKLEEYHIRINSIQFEDHLGFSSFKFEYPDITFHDTYEIKLGGKTIQIIHGKGETDDHCFIFVEEDKIVYSGDMFVWSFPNIGNPLKVVRYEYEWYETLERILQLEPEALIPGHGQAIKDKNKIKEAFQDVIDALRYVHDETIKHINKGTDVNEAVRQVKLPKRLAESPYVQQIYGSVPFTVQGMYRRYTGWFDGNPSNLNPASKEAVAQEMLSLIDNDEAVLARSRALIKEGDNRLAMHLLDLLIFGKNNDEAIQLKKQAIQNEAEVSTNFIMRNIYRGLSK